MSEEKGKRAAELAETERNRLMSRDLDLECFESKARSTMRDLLEPFLHKGFRDREMLLCLEKEDDKMNERLNLLEMAVYKMHSSENGKTKFDEISDRFLEVEIQYRHLKENLDDKLTNFSAKVTH